MLPHRLGVGRRLTLRTGISPAASTCNTPMSLLWAGKPETTRCWPGLQVLDQGICSSLMKVLPVLVCGMSLSCCLTLAFAGIAHRV